MNKIVKNMFKVMADVGTEVVKSAIPGSSIFLVGCEKILSIKEEERNDMLIEDIKSKVLTMDENKLDKDFIYSEEFVRICWNILNKAKKDYTDTKKEYFSNCFINFSTINLSNTFYKEMYVEYIDKYKIEHIKILKSLYDCILKQKPKHENEEQYMITTSCRGSKFDQEIPSNIDKDKRDICVGDLSRDNFIYQNEVDWMLTKKGYNFIKVISEN